LSRFQLARKALADLGEIAEFIAEDSHEAAARVLDQIYRAFAFTGEVAIPWAQP
jgi:plasmid stabilization system protein ParE